MNSLKVIVIIVEHKKASKVLKRLNGLNMINVLHGQGTADSELMDIFGLSSSDKDIILATVTEEDKEAVLTKLKEKLKFETKHGIAFTIPIKYLSGKATEHLLSGQNIKEKK